MNATICDCCGKVIKEKLDVRLVVCTMPNDRDKVVWTKEVCPACAMKAERKLMEEICS